MRLNVNNVKNSRLFLTDVTSTAVRLPSLIRNSVRFNWPHVSGESQHFIHTVPMDPHITKGAVWVPRDLHCDSGLLD